MRLRAWMVAFSLLVAPALLTACGGGGEKKLSRAAAVSKVNTLCRASSARTDRIDVQSTGTDAAFTRQVDRLAREQERLKRQLDDLALGGSSEAVATYAQAQARVAAAARGLITAVKNKRSADSTGLDRALAANKKAKDAALVVAETAGVRECGPHQADLADAASTIKPGTPPRLNASRTAFIPGSELVGTWDGIATQVAPDGTNSTFPVYFRIDPNIKADGGNGGIRYDSYNCIGRVKIVSAEHRRGEPGYRYELKETILIGRKKCGPGRKITVVTEGDELDWRWSSAYADEVGILRRRGAPARPSVADNTIREIQAREYRGTAQQYGPRGQKASYPVRLGLYPPGKGAGKSDVIVPDGWVEYPETGCVGYFLIDQTRGDRAEMTEHITKGRCYDNGRVETRRTPNGKLLFRWYRQKDDGKAEIADNIVLGTLSDYGPPRRSPLG